MQFVSLCSRRAYAAAAFLAPLLQVDWGMKAICEDIKNHVSDVLVLWEEQVR